MIGPEPIIIPCMTGPIIPYMPRPIMPVIIEQSLIMPGPAFIIPGPIMPPGWHLRVRLYDVEAPADFGGTTSTGQCTMCSRRCVTLPSISPERGP
jgi:hypothetical protein